MTARGGRVQQIALTDHTYSADYTYFTTYARIVGSIAAWFGVCLFQVSNRTLSPLAAKRNRHYVNTIWYQHRQH